jgi:hypothetical protein
MSSNRIEQTIDAVLNLDQASDLDGIAGLLRPE